MATSYYTVGESTTLTVLFEKINNAFVDPPTYVAYAPVTPTIIITAPNGTAITYTGVSVVAGPTTGEYKMEFIWPAVGEWMYEGSDPSLTSPGFTQHRVTVVPRRTN